MEEKRNSDHDPMNAIHYECIDPELGQELWRLADPTTDPELVARLRAHTQHCAACRLLATLDADIGGAVADGSLVAPDLAPRARSRTAWLTWTGSVALAASLALLILLPPRSPLADRVMRSPDRPLTIERPVADEVIASSRPTIAWSAPDRARAFDVSVTSVDGAYEWSGRTEESSVRIPPERPLPAGRRFRVSLVPVPEHLAPEGGIGSSFRRGSLIEAVGFRFANGGWPLKAVAGLGGVLLVIGVVGAVVRRR